MNDERIMMQLAFMQMWEDVQWVLEIINDELDETSQLAWVLARAPSTNESVDIMNRIWNRISSTRLEKIINKAIRVWEPQHVMEVLFQPGRMDQVSNFIKVTDFVETALVDTTSPDILQMIPLNIFERVVRNNVFFDLGHLVNINRPDILSFCLHTFCYTIHAITPLVANFAYPEMVVTFFEHPNFKPFLNQGEVKVFMRKCSEIDTDASYQNIKLVYRMYLNNIMNGFSLNHGCSSRFSEFKSKVPLAFEDDDPDLLVFTLGKRKSNSRIPEEMLQQISEKVLKRQKNLEGFRFFSPMPESSSSE